MKIILILFGLIIGYVLRGKNELMTKISFAVFSIILPYVVVAEVSSMNLGEWWYFIYGSLFVFGFFYFGRLVMKLDKHKAALLATAEGGTLSFVLYNLIGTEPLSRFFLIDMLGNGAILFSFIYWQVGQQYKLRSFLVNPLMVAMGTGITLNLLRIRLLSYTNLSIVEPFITTVLIMFVSVVTGAAVVLHVSRDIFLSRFFWKFWLIRIAIAITCIYLKLPLGLIVLFPVPPSFLLPVIYGAGQEKEREYASNFIAACLPIFFFLSVSLLVYYS